MYLDALASLLLLAAFIQTTILLTGRIATKLAPKPDVRKLINQDRVARGLPPLEQ